jgi:hypothetical protein
MAFGSARRNLFDFAPLDPFQLDGGIGDGESRREYVEVRTTYTDKGFCEAVVLFSVQSHEFFVGHG